MEPIYFVERLKVDSTEVKVSLVMPRFTSPTSVLAVADRESFNVRELAEVPVRSKKHINLTFSFWNSVGSFAQQSKL